LVQFEDFSSDKAQTLLNHYRHHHLMFQRRHSRNWCYNACWTSRCSACQGRGRRIFRRSCHCHCRCW
jgi:Ribonuclease G/E